MATQASTADHHGDAGHVSSIGAYLTIFGILLVLTVVTVMVSYMGLPPLASIMVAMAIAGTKAMLVVMYFMHLKYDVPFNSFVFFSAVWFLLIFFAFTVIDLGTRGSVLQIQDNFQLRADQAAGK